MPSVSISNWKYGLDTRRSQLTSVPGTLLQIQNAHINQGAEVEKRKAFVRKIQPTGTFGAQPTPSTIYVFGSTTDPGVQPPFTYQQLTVPSGASMTGVVCSTLFANEPFVVATFSDLKTYAFYNGSYLSDFIAGEANIFPNNAGIAEGLAALVNASGLYTAIYNNGGVGVDTFDVFSIPTTIDGNAYTSNITLSSTAGILTSSNISAGSASTAAGIATGSFQIVAGTCDVQGTLTASVVPNDGDTVTIGATTYTFKTALTPAANEVLIGGSAGVAMANLSMAISASGTAGTNYTSDVTANASATATAVNASNAITVNAIVSTAVAASESTGGTRLVWSGLSAGNLAAGTKNYVSSIKVGALEILGANIAYAKDLTTTIANVVNQIISYSAAHPDGGGNYFTASSNGNTITLSTHAGTATYNGAVITVTAHGMFFCDNCMFSITGTSFTCDYVKVSSINQMTAVLTFPTNTESIAYFAQRIVQNINVAAGSYNALALPGTATIFISKTTTATSDATLPVSVSLTGTAGGSGGSSNPLAVSFNPTSCGFASSGQGGSGIVLGNGDSKWILFTPVTAVVTGGAPPYSYTYTVQNTFSWYVKQSGTGWVLANNSVPVPSGMAQVIDSGWSPASGGASPIALGPSNSSPTVALFGPGNLGNNSMWGPSAYLAGDSNITPVTGGNLTYRFTFYVSVQVTDSAGASGIAGPIPCTVYLDEG